MEFVKDGEIVLNISEDAAHRLTLGNDAIQFRGAFQRRVARVFDPGNAVYRDLREGKQARDLVFPARAGGARPMLTRRRRPPNPSQATAHQWRQAQAADSSSINSSRLNAPPGVAACSFLN